MRTAGATFAAVALAASAATADGLHRYAVVVGNDEGGGGTRPLLFAREDARRFRGILTRLGGVAPQDAALVLDGTADQFLTALGQMEARAHEASLRGERTALFVYYSGHAKDGALRLGDTRLPFASLKSRLAQSAADIRIAIFDACQSGAMTRAKGARRAPEFAIETDPARDARGLVILTSSAANEESQESDQLGGSYFSHHLVSGLLGDADRSGDGKVSLAEAYAYAYERTVADTAQTSAGAQHPTFSYDLAGNGDLVLTDVAQRKEGLLFPSIAPHGTYYVVDGKGFVAAEVVKSEDQEKRIGLAPGGYVLERRLPDRLRVGRADVAPGQVALVDESRFHDAPFSADPVKGADIYARYRAHVSLSVDAAAQAFLDSGARGDLFPPAGLLGLELGLNNVLPLRWSWGFDLLLGGARGTLTLPSLNLPPLGFDMTELCLGTTVQRAFPVGPWAPFLGLRVAMLLFTRKFDPIPGAVLPQQFFATASPGLVAGVSYRFSDALSLTLRARLHEVLYTVDRTQSLPFWEASAAVTYEL